MRRVTFLVAGVLWLFFAFGFGFFLLLYLGQGAGLQFFGWMFSSGSVLVGLVYVVGCVVAAFLCFTIGTSLLARGFVRTGDDCDKTKLEDSGPFAERSSRANSHQPPRF